MLAIGQLALGSGVRTVFWGERILARVVGSRIPGREGFPNVEDPYALSIYICAGLLPWLTLSETLTRNSLAFLSHSNLIKKVSFPHPILVLYQVISGLITLFIMHALLIIVMIVTGHRIPLSIVWLGLFVNEKRAFML